MTGPISTDRRRSHRTGAFVATLATVILLVDGAASTEAQDDAGTGLSSIVVTTDVLGSVVADLVGDEADVTVLMDAGANPHAWEPSARDSERVLGADLVVANGLDLEAGVMDLLDAAAVEGVPLFLAGDYVELAATDHDAETGGGSDHDHAAVDPHFWTDPLAMRDVILALVPALAAVGVDVADAGADMATRLEALAAEVVEIVAVIPGEDRSLVTGHVSLRYFADRFGFEVMGTIIPGLTTQGEPSARELAQLVSDIREAGVPAIFTEVGTPQAVAEAIAEDSGARVVGLQIASLPPDGSYFTLIRDIATTVAEGLAGVGR